MREGEATLTVCSLKQIWELRPHLLGVVALLGVLALEPHNTEQRLVRHRGLRGERRNALRRVVARLNGETIQSRVDLAQAGVGNHDHVGSKGLP